jgi:hypothetical protein
MAGTSIEIHLSGGLRLRGMRARRGAVLAPRRGRTSLGVETASLFPYAAVEQKSIGDIARELSARAVPTRRGAARWGPPNDLDDPSQSGLRGQG